MRIRFTKAHGAMNDFLLTWAANSGKYVTGEKDADGNDVQVFSSAGTTGYELMQKPKCADGDKTVFACFQDRAGNIASAATSDAVVLDTARPTATPLLDGLSSGGVINRSTVTLSWP